MKALHPITRRLALAVLAAAFVVAGLMPLGSAEAAGSLNLSTPQVSWNSGAQ